MNGLQCVAIVAIVLLACKLNAQTPQIRGTVRDTNGAPLVGVEVKRYPSWGRSIAITDTNGHFQLDVGVNTGTKPFLVVRDPNRNLAVARPIEEGTELYDLQLAPALTISGRVLDEVGQPMSNANVYISGLWDNSLLSIDYNKPPKLDPQGRFEIPALPIGRRYSVNVSAKGFGSAQVKSENLETNRVELAPITLKATDKKIAGVVVDADNNPVKGARVFLSGEGQPNTSVVTDENGRFSKDKISAGIVILSASSPATSALGYAQGEAQAGDTNVLLILVERTGWVPAPPQQASALGRSIPDLAAVGIPADSLQTKQLLICLFDPEQRPSRRAIRLLAEQNESLKQKGITVVAISAVLTTTDTLNQWKQANPQPFPVSGVFDKNDKTKWILDAQKFPWLILTDPQGKVKAEGFDLDDLDAKLTGK